MKKRVFSILTALCLCLILLPTAALAGDGTLSGTGTREDPYQIQNQDDLLAFADIVNGTNGVAPNTAACAIVIKSFVVSMNDSWTPMGSEDAPYTGTFVCAEDVEIKRLYIKVASDQIGLFGYIQNAVIDNVSLVDAMITGDTDVGGIAGVAVNSVIKNCTVSGTPRPGSNGELSTYSWGVRGSESVGGIVGRLEDSCVKDCTNKAAVYLITTGDESARHKLGGIVGVATLSADACSEESAILISKCTNEGKVTCTTMENYECTGGIVGRLVSDNANYRAVVTNCTNNGLVSSIEAGTGGIVGYAQNASIEDCKNTAGIVGTTGVGGIAGYAYYGTQIIRCTNTDTGSVTGNLYSNGDDTVYPYNIGGIVGSVYNPRDTSHLEGDCDSLPVYSYNKDSLISRCTNNGIVTCNYDWTEEMPTIVSLPDGTPYAVNIFGAFVGGIAGFAVDSAYFDEEGNTIRIEQCDNHGAVSGSSYCGGILGVGKNAAVTSCTSDGVVAKEGDSDTDSIRADIGGYSYTIRFQADGGSLEPQDALMLAHYGILERLPSLPRRIGCRFDGWYTAPRGGQRVTAETVYTKSTTLYAHWTYAGLSGSTAAPTYSATATTANNGSVTVSPKNAGKGATITITVTPDAGCTLETLTVLDQNGNEIELTNLGNGKYTFQMPAGNVTVTATFMEDNTILNFFVDVTADKYYYDAVLWAATNGIVGGVDENHFGPDMSCTRAQLVTFLWRASGCPVVNYAMSFTDVDENDYYGEAVRWAAALGIAGGYGNGLFGTEDTITREQAATILYRFAVAMGMDVSTGADTNILSYDDVFEVGDFAVSAFQWATGAGVVQGADGNLMPKANCARAQIVVMLYRLLGE